ncbi:MAG: ABC transporter ATP-binding protein [Chloroflexota bacterium]|nr:MAG: ABC transporter ATP-binding protein [Chloroflexota bacterium]
MAELGVALRIGQGLGGGEAASRYTTSLHTETIIRIEGLGHKFQRTGKQTASGREVVALEDINLEIKRGEFFALIGPSGCGKSTLLSIIAGLMRPSSGTVGMNGALVEKPGLDRGVVFQEYALFPWRTALQNVEFGLESQRVPKAERARVAEKYLSLVGLREFAHSYPHQLSGGMKQRVAIARALAPDPEVLLMDEPFGALDTQTREILQNELLRISFETGKTIVFVTHSIEEAVLLADRVAVITARPGRIKQIAEIPLARSDRLCEDVRSSPTFIALRRELSRLLGEEVTRAQKLNALQARSAEG